MKKGQKTTKKTGTIKGTKINKFKDQVMTFKTVSLKTLKHNPLNPVIRTDDTNYAFKALVNNIRKNGLLVPIMVANNHMVIDGNRRLRALELLNVKKVPVVMHNSISHLTFDDLFVSCNEDTMKITIPADLQRAEEIFSKKNTGLYRIGLGFDVHRFGKGQHVNLCGIEVPHNQGLIGHSDADVCLHALTDAILGAIAKGDIGELFPDNQARWKNESSSTFLRHAKSLVEAAKGKIINVDLNIICESPKISDYRTEMRQTLATLMDLSIDQISVKATTTERLGFLGRVEGIAAQAIAMLYLSNNVNISDDQSVL